MNYCVKSYFSILYLRRLQYYYIVVWVSLLPVNMFVFCFYKLPFNCCFQIIHFKCVAMLTLERDHAVSRGEKWWHGKCNEMMTGRTGSQCLWTMDEKVHLRAYMSQPLWGLCRKTVTILNNDVALSNLNTESINFQMYAV